MPEQFMIGGAAPDVLRSLVEVIHAEPGAELVGLHGDPAAPSLLLVNADPAVAESLRAKIAGRAVLESNAPLEGGPAPEDIA